MSTTGSAKRVLRFWRNNLADQERSEIRLGVEEGEFRISGVEMRRGKLSVSSITKLFAKYDELIASKRRAKGGERAVEQIEVLIAPFLLRSVVSNGASNKRDSVIAPLWLSATIRFDGTFIPNHTRPPWIPRYLLSPPETNDLVFGTVDAADTFQSRNDFLSVRTWADALEYCTKFLNTVCEVDLKHDAFDGYRLDCDEGCLLIDTEKGGVSRAIIQLYDRVLTRKKLPTLFLRFASLVSAPLRPLYRGRLHVVAASRFVSQMHRNFPLSPSQRETVQHLLMQGSGTVSAVNGPPGNGKTAMIPSIIASFWTAAALKRGNPPLIVVTSTNNQAVQNVILALKVPFHGGHELLKPWIPSIASYGTWCISEGRQAEAERDSIPWITKRGLGSLFPAIGSALSIERSQQHFITAAQVIYRRTFTLVQQVVPLLHCDLRRAVRLIAQGEAIATSYRSIRHHSSQVPLVQWIHDTRMRWTVRRFNSFVRRADAFLDSFGSAFPLATPWRIDQLSEQLDQSLRHVAFFLTSHYWEGRWIVAHQFNSQPDSRRRDQSVHADKWRRYSMLSPCFVSTLHMLQHFFDPNSDNSTFVRDPIIDLVIVEEAGQVLPELAALPMLLARQAIVVGDRHQTRPISTLLSEVDLANARAAQVSVHRDPLVERDRLDQLGILSATGDALAIAQRHTPFSNAGHGERGFLLKEHRRCRDPIIAVCNDLAYGGSLLPLRGDLLKHPLPALGYAHVGGQCESRGGSRCNGAEAQAIAQWLKGRQAQLFQVYPGKPLAKIVGIVTPFRAQRDVLNAELAKLGMEEVTVGTIHTFQGAERPLILFSPVYAADRPRSFFFDRDETMINVAVSRAQDSFLVFGDMEILDPRAGSLPTAVLARHLFSAPDNALPDTPAICTRTAVQDSFERIDSLAGHRLLLHTALKKARRRVVIVSPFLSLLAMESDELGRKAQEAVSRGVQVIVYTSRDLHPERGGAADKFVNAVRYLRDHGVTVRVCKNIHSKALCRDDEMLCEGSFNWLSAARDEQSLYHRYESSLFSEGRDVSTWIHQLIERLERQVVGDLVSLPAGKSAPSAEDATLLTPERLQRAGNSA